MGKLNSTQTNKRNTVSGLTYDGAVIGRRRNGSLWVGRKKERVKNNLIKKYKEKWNDLHMK